MIADLARIEIQAHAVAPDGSQVCLLILRDGMAFFLLVPIDPAVGTSEIALHLGRCNGLAWSPDCRRLAFIGPSATMPMCREVYLLDVESGVYRSLTAHLPIHPHLVAWSPDGRAIVFAAYEPPIRGDHPPHLFTIDLVTGDVVQRTTDSAADFTPYFSPDGRSIAFRRDGEIWLLLLSQREPRRLTNLGRCELGRDCFSPDGELLICEYGPSERRQVATISLVSGVVRPWSVDGVDLRSPCWSPDGQQIAVVEDRRRIQLCTANGVPLQLLDPGYGAIATRFYTALQWVPDSNSLTLLIDGDLHLLAPDGIPRRLTNFSGALQGAVPPETITYSSLDKRVVAAQLFRAQHQGARTRHAVIWVHGGPREREDPHNPYIQALVAAGYHVLVPDYRGSIGYGLDWAELTPDEAGIVDVGDVVAGGYFLRSAFALPTLSVVGYSYGGYLALLALAAAPTLWTSGVSLWGIMAAQRSPWLRDIATRQSEGWLAARSPVAQAGSIAAPLLLLHGANDTIATVEEVQAVASRLGERGVPCELRIFWDDTHGLHRHTRECCELLLEFLRR